MKRKHLFTGLLAVLVTGSFAAGLFEPELMAQGGLPELLSSFRPSAGGRELDPVNTYSRVLQQIRDKFAGEAPGDRQLTYAAVRGMLATLDDPYTRFLDPQEFRALTEKNDGTFEGIGASLAPNPTKEGFVRIVRPIQGGPAARAGVRKNDLITKVDGKSVNGLSVSDVVKLIRGRAGTTVRLTIQREGAPKPLELPIVRAPVQVETVQSRMLDGGVGYVYVSEFNKLSDEKMHEAIVTLGKQGLKALVLDLRGNPGGLLESAIDISSRFIPPGKDVVSVVENGGDREVRRTKGSLYLGGKWPVAVLVNRMSASASEIVSGAIKDQNAGLIVGTTTFGKGLVQELLPLEGESACLITTAKYYTPSGADINRSRDRRGGVEPHVTVEVTQEQFFKNEDPQLAKAVDLLHEKTGYRPSPGKGGKISGADRAIPVATANRRPQGR